MLSFVWGSMSRYLQFWRGFFSERLCVGFSWSVIYSGFFFYLFEGRARILVYLSRVFVFVGLGVGCGFFFCGIVMSIFLGRVGLLLDKRVVFGCFFRDVAIEVKIELVLRKWVGQWRWFGRIFRFDCGRSTDRILEVSSSLSRKIFSFYFLGKGRLQKVSLGWSWSASFLLLFLEFAFFMFIVRVFRFGALRGRVVSFLYFRLIFLEMESCVFFYCIGCSSEFRGQEMGFYCDRLVWKLQCFFF